VLPADRPETRSSICWNLPGHYLEVVRAVRNELTRRSRTRIGLKELIELVQG